MVVVSKSPSSRSGGTVSRASHASADRNRASAAGWVPPAEWDEADLDDPYAEAPARAVERKTTLGRESVDLDAFVSGQIDEAERQGLTQPEEPGEELGEAGGVIPIGPRLQRTAKEWATR